jgi:integrase
MPMADVPSSAPKPKLLDQVREAIRMRHFSPRTEETYVHWIKRFIFFHNKRHPAEMAEPEIARFLSNLASESRVSGSTQNQALNALLFLYHYVLGKEIGYVNGVVRAKKAPRLPVVLTRGEIQALLSYLNGSERIMATLLYGAGLRLMECCRLRVKDIDFSQNQIVVRAGKGDKDRYTMLPTAVKELLIKHLDDGKRQHQNDIEKNLGRVVLPMRWIGNIPTLVKSGHGSGFFRRRDTTLTAKPDDSTGIIFTNRYYRKPCAKPLATPG